MADFQVPLALGTQTGGSTIRPASFNGVYGLKTTWGVITREGQKVYALTFDVIGLFGRSPWDLEILADALGVRDDEESTFATIRGATFALCKTAVWPKASEGTVAVVDKAVELLRKHGAVVEEIELPSEFSNLTEWHRIALHCEGRATFLPEYRSNKHQLSSSLAAHVENREGVTRKQQCEAYDGMAALRPRFDAIAQRYAAVLAPSAVEEAHVGLQYTGSAAFCDYWSVSGSDTDWVGFSVHEADP